MIRTLKKKFIVTAMIAVTVLLAVLLGAVNAVNAWSSRQEAESLLDYLTRQEAMNDRPDWMREDERDAPPPMPGEENPAQQEPNEAPPDPPGGFEEQGEERRGRGFLSEPLTENDWRAAVYFTVRVSDGAVTQADVSRISSVSEEEAAAYGKKALAKGSQGSLDSFRYASAQAGDGTTVYVFLENSARRTAVLRVAALSALAGLAGWGLMLLLVILLSRKAIAPIAANMERQRQFVTDAGHELKTPLAIIQANAEAMELISGETKWSRNIRTQVRRLSDLTGNLLTLARAEEVPAQGSFTEVDFSALMEQTEQMFREPLELKGCALESALTPGLRVRGNQAQLSTLCSILLDNAAKYAPDGSSVLLNLEQADKSLHLRVENDCEALPDCPPDRLFDRFYRADAARTQSSGGFGIGLSAAQVIVNQHRGRIEAAYLSDRRIAFTVTLPTI